jgi:carboxylesterase type B
MRGRPWVRCAGAPWSPLKDGMGRGPPRAAKSFGAIAVQTAGACFILRETQQSEDCLSLNVWTASLDREAKQPVMLWIHGGGYLGASGSEDAYDGANLARQGITVVTFNYRLGVYGFLAHPDVGANFAVLDFLAVLEWIAQNIRAFGGNPDNVTVFGETSGAAAVRTLLSTRRARGLFHRGIMQSAGFEPIVIAPPSRPTVVASPRARGRPGMVPSPALIITNERREFFIAALLGSPMRTRSQLFRSYV